MIGRSRTEDHVSREIQWVCVCVAGKLEVGAICSLAGITCVAKPFSHVSTSLRSAFAGALKLALEVAHKSGIKQIAGRSARLSGSSRALSFGRVQPALDLRQGRAFVNNHSLREIGETKCLTNTSNMLKPLECLTISWNLFKQAHCLHGQICPLHPWPDLPTASMARSAHCPAFGQ